MSEEVRRLLNDNKDLIRSFLENVANAFFGNPVAIFKIFEAVTKSPVFIREQIFWNKFAMFLDGIHLSNNDLGKLRIKFSENGDAQENVERMITLIDRAETKLKIQYFINATLSLRRYANEYSCTWTHGIGIDVSQ